MKEILLILSGLLSVGLILADPSWNDPPFECIVKSSETIQNCDDIDPAIIYVTIYEEVASEIKTIYINCNDCDDPKNEPIISTFEDGSASLLGAIIEKEASKWVLKITKKQDYEIKAQQLYIFQILVGDDEKRVKVMVQDIDDNPPIITANQPRCKIEENLKDRSNCSYTITDPDTVTNLSALNYSFTPTDRKLLFRIDPRKEDTTNKLIIVDLTVIKELDFETEPLYVFSLNAMDQGNNTGTTSITLEVIDVNDQPPKWMEIFAIQRFYENHEQEFEVFAKDGDVTIDSPIGYKIYNCDTKDISIKVNTVKKENRNYGQIKIDPVDRDILKNDLITCVIEAFEIPDPSWNATADIAFMILDENDNAPKINATETEFKIDEYEVATLNGFQINDIDLGINAQYDVRLTSQQNYHEAFQIIPNTGYQLWTFDISVLKPTLLDYEQTDWRDFIITLEATDRGQNNLNSKIDINIKLNNMNNKIPYFTTQNYVAKLREDILENKEIITVEAKDDDTGDSVLYDFSVAASKNIYTIDTGSGLIKTIHNNTFDYEKQTQVFIMVQAQDQMQDGKNPLHTVTTQILVDVLDVNDETPRLQLPTQSPQIKENEPVDTPITDKIHATDPDGTAFLTFDIDWSQTTASKPGKIVERKQFEGVFKIETISAKNRGNVIGKLKVAKKELLDYEEFEVIYLYIKVIDENQEINDDTDSAIMTVRIIDLNDNPPIFNDASINANNTVEENAKLDTFIGTISATDIDGPGNNIIKFSLNAIDAEDTGFVNIDEDSGQLYVTNDKIDADGPPKKYYLRYEVVASDSVNVVSKEISIFIVDINDEFPKLKTDLNKLIRVDEGTIDQHLQVIDGIDLDRDYPRNYVNYYLNTLGHAELRPLFTVNDKTGEVRVSVQEGSAGLDRDDGPDTYEIYLILRDNLGGAGSNELSNISFTVRLNDINNKAPILQDIIIPDISENDFVGKKITTITAVDKDELCTKNTEITYEITQITDDKNELIDSIFKFHTTRDIDCKYYGELIIDKELKDKYYGNFKIYVKASDAGIPQQYNEKIYSINIIPFNFKTPVITYPKINETIILSQKQNLNSELITISSGLLAPFQANDDQGNKFKMSFTLLDTNGDESIFKLKINDNNEANLQLVQQPEKDMYNLKLKASHTGSGEASNSVEQTFKILFTDRNALPNFLDPTYLVSFLEEQDGLCEPFPEAHDVKCQTTDNCLFQTYYHIINGDDNDNFEIQMKGTIPNICVQKKLDREQIDFVYLTILATNVQDAPVGKPENAMALNLTVKVIDINDNPPEFSSNFFSGSLTVGDIPERSIIELIASDPDVSDEGKLTYAILKDTIKTSDSSLDAVKDKSPFQISDTNHIVSSFKVIPEMKGFFTFDVTVTDSPPERHFDTAQVKIYIISDANRVVFTFMNKVDEIKTDKDYIEKVFSDVFHYNCTVDDAYKKIDESTGNTLEDQTDVKTHFINEEKNEAVEKEIITVKSAEFATVSLLRVRFQDKGLNFSDVPVVDLADAKNLEKLLLTLLIVVSVVLGTLCIVLVVAFILRTRSLKKRLEKMTTNVFGSTKSDLNRIGGTNAPGTNKHAVEANPVWNEDLDKVNQFDSISQGSGSSDLIGIEDNPEFQYIPNYRKDSVNPVIQQQIKRKSVHNPLAITLDEPELDSDHNFKPTLDFNENKDYMF